MEKDDIQAPMQDQVSKWGARFLARVPWVLLSAIERPFQWIGRAFDSALDHLHVPGEPWLLTCACLPSRVVSGTFMAVGLIVIVVIEFGPLLTQISAVVFLAVLVVSVSRHGGDHKPSKGSGAEMRLPISTPPSKTYARVNEVKQQANPNLRGETEKAAFAGKLTFDELKNRIDVQTFRSQSGRLIYCSPRVSMNFYYCNYAGEAKVWTIVNPASLKPVTLESGRNERM